MPNGRAYIDNIDTIVNHTLSMYAKKNTFNYISNALSDNRVLCVNKKEINRLEKILGLQLPNNLFTVDLPKNIADYKEFVNSNIRKNIKNDTKKVKFSQAETSDVDYKQLLFENKKLKELFLLWSNKALYNEK